MASLPKLNPTEIDLLRMMVSVSAYKVRLVFGKSNLAADALAVRTVVRKNNIRRNFIYSLQIGLRLITISSGYFGRSFHTFGPAFALGLRLVIRVINFRGF